MKSPLDLTPWSIAAIALAATGVALGLAAMLDGNPYLGLFSVTVVCAGAVAAIVGLQDS